jgi:hypothetical protein
MLALLDHGLYAPPHPGNSVLRTTTSVHCFILFPVHFLINLLFLCSVMPWGQSRSLECWVRISKWFTAFPTGFKFPNSWRNMRLKSASHERSQDRRGNNYIVLLALCGKWGESL